MMEEAGCFIQR